MAARRSVRRWPRAHRRVAHEERNRASSRGFPARPCPVWARRVRRASPRVRGRRAPGRRANWRSRLVDHRRAPRARDGRRVRGFAARPLHASGERPRAAAPIGRWHGDLALLLGVAVPVRGVALLATPVAGGACRRRPRIRKRGRRPRVRASDVRATRPPDGYCFQDVVVRIRVLRRGIDRSFKFPGDERGRLQPPRPSPRVRPAASRSERTPSSSPSLARFRAPRAFRCTGPTLSELFPRPANGGSCVVSRGRVLAFRR